MEEGKYGLCGLCDCSVVFKFTLVGDIGWSLVFGLSSAVCNLRRAVCPSNWVDGNYDRLPGTQAAARLEPKQRYRGIYL